MAGTVSEPDSDSEPLVAAARSGREYAVARPWPA